jgi:hypothetical protein
MAVTEKQPRETGVSLLGLLGVLIAIVMVVGSVGFYAVESGLIGAGGSSATANTQRAPATTTGSGATR